MTHPVATVDMVAYLREHNVSLGVEVDALRDENQALRDELALCEQDLRHALTRISELCEQLEGLRL